MWPITFGIGAVVGLIMGLTGAGGALIAIILFMEFMGLSLKEASVYSLIAVVLAAFLNLLGQRNAVKTNLVTGLVLSSVVGSLLSQPFKSLLPDGAIAFILAVLSLLALYGLWFPGKRMSQGNQEYHFLGKSIVIGVFLGALTTLTGLGGGVLMLPIMLRLYRLPEKEAVASSLAVVGLSALFSFLLQFGRANSALEGTAISSLALGVAAMAFSLKLLLQRLPEGKVMILRKLVFTAVVVISLLKLT